MTCTSFYPLKIPGFGDDLYSICGCGQHVKSNRVDKLMTVRTDAGGQQKEVNLSTPGGGIKKKFKIHYLMALVFMPYYDPEKHEIVHKDGNRANNHIQNLKVRMKGDNPIPCNLHPIEMPGFPLLSANYKICRCGEHLFSVVSDALISQHTTQDGYKACSLKVAEGKNKIFFVHQLVANTFLKKMSEDELVVDHINRDRKDNRVENLRFATYAENSSNVTRNDNKKPVVQHNLDGTVVKEYDSITDIIKENPQWSSAGICICLRNDLMKYTAYGFRWRYKNEEDNIKRFVPEEGEVSKVIKGRHYNIETKEVEDVDWPNYCVTNYGRVYKKRGGAVIGSKVRDCISVTFNVGKNKNKLYRVHTLVAIMFLDPPAPGHHFIRFKDGNKYNCRADNLEWTTQRELSIEKNGIRVVGTKDGVEREFRSLSEAAEFVWAEVDIDGCVSTALSGIKACLVGYQESAYGYAWKKV